MGRAWESGAEALAAGMSSTGGWAGTAESSTWKDFVALRITRETLRRREGRLLRLLIASLKMSMRVFLT